MKHKSILAILLVGGILVLDVATKQWAYESLSHGGTIEAAGVPLTLAFNTGIAFGLDIPSAGRWILIAASVFVVIMLAGMFHQAKENDWTRVVAISLVAAGALGNLRDRVRWDRGVVDFIGPIDLGFMHWPIFNVADMAITTGAIVLGFSLWREGSEAKAVAEAREAAGATDTGA